MNDVYWNTIDAIEGVEQYNDLENEIIVRALKIDWGEEACQVCDLFGVPAYLDYYNAFFLDGVFCSAWDYLVIFPFGEIKSFSGEDFGTRFQYRIEQADPTRGGEQ